MELFARVRPAVVHLIGPVGREVTVPVRIVPEKKYAFRITGVRLLRGRYVACKLEETAAPEGPEYLLTVKNLRKKRGRYSDIIILKTTSDIRPEIRLIVYGNIYATAGRVTGKGAGRS